MITTSFNSGAGQIELNILSSHTSTASVSQIGQLRYSFDQTPDTLSIDRVQALYTYMNIDLLQYDDGGNDLWEVLISETNSATIQVTLEVVLPDGAFGFLFKIRKPDISLNDKSGVVTLRLTPFTNFNTNMGTLFDSMYSDGVSSRRFLATSLNDNEDRATYRYNAFPSSTFISRSLNSVFDNAYDSVISSSDTDLGDDYTEKVFDGFGNDKKQFVVCDIRAGIPPTQTQQVGIGTPVEETDDGSGVLSGFAFYQPTGESPFRFKIVVAISSDNGIVVGDDIYIGDASTKEAGRRLGAVIGLPTNALPKYIIQLNEDDPFPFSTDDSLPFKIARGNRPENELVIDVLKGMAGVEGSIFGSGFSKNWYINRLSKEEQGSPNLVTINYNEVIDFRPFNFDLSLGRSVVGQVADYNSIGDDLFGQWGLKATSVIDDDNEQIGSGVPNLGPFTSVTPGNRGATKGLDIQLAPAYPFLNKGYIDPAIPDIIFGSKIVGETDEVIQDLALESAFTRNGLKSYFQSLNSSKDSIAVEFTVIGSQRVLPYELFQFDSRAPEKYRDKQFRITEVSYDLVNDTCKLKGYQIDDLTTPVVDDPRPRIAAPRVPPPYTADPIGVLLRGVDDADVDTLRINFYTSINTGSSIMVLNDLEREQGYFRESDAGQYEVNTAKGDVADTIQGSFVGALKDTIQGEGDTFLEIRIVAQAVITLTAGDSLVLHNLAGQTETVVVSTTTVTTVGGTTVVPINSVVLNNLYKAELSFLATPSYTPNIEVTTFPTGDSEIPLDGTSRINAPEGSFVYLTSTYESTGIEVTKAFTEEVNLRLIDTDSNLVATQESLSGLTSTVSNIDGVVTAQGSFLVSLNSTVTNIETNVSGQATAIFNLNTRVTAGEGYLISNASAVIAIESRIDNPTTGLNASATAIIGLDTRVTAGEGYLISNASAITVIQSNITGIEGDISGQATAISLLETNVSSIDGILTATAGRVDVIEVNVTTLNGQFSAVSSDVSNVSIEVDEVTGKVTNISAKRAIVVGANNRLARIDLAANDGDGSTGSTSIDIEADQITFVTNIMSVSGNILIGKGLAALQTDSTQLLMGEAVAGTPYVQARRDNNNFVEMVARPAGSADHLLLVKSGGDEVLKVTPTGLTIIGDGTFSGALSGATGTFTGALSGGTVSIGAGNNIFKADEEGIYLGNASFGSAPFSVTPAGVLKAQSGTVGGWSINSERISRVVGNTSTGNRVEIGNNLTAVKDRSGVYIGLDTNNLTPIVEARIGDGTDARVQMVARAIGDTTNHIFQVKQGGVDVINVTAGVATVGGWTLGASTLTGGGVTLNSGGSVSIGSGDSIFKADGGGIYLGNASFASAPFSVTPTGALKAESGTIGGFAITATTLIGGAASADTIGLASTGTWRLWMGNSTPADAPFRVQSNGDVFAENITANGKFIGDMSGFIPSGENLTITGAIYLPSSVSPNVIISGAKGVEFVNPTESLIDKATLKFTDGTNIKAEMFSTASGTTTLRSYNQLLLEASNKRYLSLAIDQIECANNIVFRLGRFTTAERNALTPENGMMIINISTSTIQGYSNSAWVDL